MLLAWIAIAAGAECALVARVDADGQLELRDRGTCPPSTYLALRNSVGQDRPLSFPEHTEVELPVTLVDGVAYVAPASAGVVRGPGLPDGPDVSHLATKVPELPADCSVLAHVDADGRVQGVRPMSCAVQDWSVAKRRTARARFSPTETGGHAVLPAPPEPTVVDAP